MLGGVLSAVMHSNGSCIELDDTYLVHSLPGQYAYHCSCCTWMKMTLERFGFNLDCYGNTSTASIPIVTVEAVEDGRLQLWARFFSFLRRVVRFIEGLI